MNFTEWDQRCMALALEEAQRAADRDEVPVGAVLTRGNVILAYGGNAQIELQDATAHAEIRMLRDTPDSLLQPSIPEGKRLVARELEPHTIGHNSASSIVTLLPHRRGSF